MLSYIEAFNKQRLYDLKQFVLLFRNNNLKTNFQSQRVLFFFLIRQSRVKVQKINSQSQRMWMENARNFVGKELLASFSHC